MKTDVKTAVEETENLDINNLYVSKHDPKLFKKFVSTATRGVYGNMEVTLTFFISNTGKMVLGELRVYEGYRVIVKCDVKRAVKSCLDDTVRKVSKNLLEIAGFSKVPHCILSEIDYRQAGALVKELLRQLTGINSALASTEIIHDWRISHNI